ncbi:hypothetical protein ACFVMC_25285 [Nocardia sp. NPDC127579]|uniref:hypothetical protein n=1 Tax=Nocardia sp. NPDC127579 TaxID=3345402 RepID=UPI003631D874
MREDDYAYHEPIPAPERSAAGQHNLMYAGLIALGVVLLQGFLTAETIGGAAKLSVSAFAVAIPLLGVLILLDVARDERARGPVATVAIGAAALGVVAAFWHVDWLAGVAVVLTTAVAAGLYRSHLPGLGRFRRGGANTAPAQPGHQPPPVRHPFPAGPEAPTTVMPHPARQPFAHGPATVRLPHEQVHPGTQQYPDQPGN